VAVNQKETARDMVVQSLKKLQFGRAERLIRINAVGSGLELKDLNECVKPAVEAGTLDAIVVCNLPLLSLHSAS
jgi:citrate lyase subunit beta-like protein